MHIIKLKNKEEIVIDTTTADKIVKVLQDAPNQKFILLPKSIIISIDMIASISPISEEIKQYDDSILDMDIDEYIPDPL